MQDNPFDPQFMDEAWGQMQAILQQEMPQKKKRRAFLWWWLLPVGVLGFSLVYLIAISNNPLIKENKHGLPPIAQYDTNGPTKEKIDLPNTATQDLPTGLSKPEVNNWDLPEVPSSKINKKPSGTAFLSKEEQFTISTPEQANTFNNPVSQLETESVAPSLPLVPQVVSSEENNPLNLSKPETTSHAEAHPATALNSSFVFDPLSIAVDLKHTPIIPQISASLPALKITPVRNHSLWTEGMLGTATPIVGQGYLGLGVSWQRKWGKKYLRLGMHYYRGNMVLGKTSSNDALEFASENSDSPVTNPDTTSSVGLNTDQSGAFINAKYQTLSLPIRLGYTLSEKWSVEAGVQFSRLLSFDSRDPLSSSSQVYIAQRLDQAEFNQNQQGIGNLDALLDSKSFFEAQLALNYHWHSHVRVNISPLSAHWRSMEKQVLQRNRWVAW